MILHSVLKTLALKHKGTAMLFKKEWVHILGDRELVQVPDHRIWYHILGRK